MRRLGMLLLLAVFWGTASGAPVAAAGILGGRCCPDCGGICVPVPEKQSQKKHCWEVECQTICIPAIKWPWQSCCEPPRCGKTRTVKVLKKVEYECERCGYKWEVQSPVCKP